MHWLKILARFARDQDGQDLVEYGLLAALVVATGVALFPTILTAMGATFQGWVPAINSVWEPPAPQ